LFPQLFVPATAVTFHSELATNGPRVSNVLCTCITVTVCTSLYGRITKTLSDISGHRGPNILRPEFSDDDDDDEVAMYRIFGRPDIRPDIKIPADVNFVKLYLFPHTSNE